MDLSCPRLRKAFFIGIGGAPVGLVSSKVALNPMFGRRLSTSNSGAVTRCNVDHMPKPYGQVWTHVQVMSSSSEILPGLLPVGGRWTPVSRPARRRRGHVRGGRMTHVRCVQCFRGGSPQLRQPGSTQGGENRRAWSLPTYSLRTWRRRDHCSVLLSTQASMTSRSILVLR